MESRELNKLLVKKFPDLDEKYMKEVSWQEGDETGSHTVYGDVFTPYLVECIEESRNEEIIRIFDYIEMLLGLEDAYVNEVVAFSILESIEYILQDKTQLINFLGEKSQKVLSDLKK